MGSTKRLIADLRALSRSVRSGRDYSAIRSSIALREDDDESEVGAEGESLKNKFESLGKRMAGISSLVEDGRKKAAVAALVKIIEESKELLANMTGNDDKDNSDDIASIIKKKISNKKPKRKIAKPEPKSEPEEQEESARSTQSASLFNLLTGGSALIEYKDGEDGDFIAEGSSMNKKSIAASNPDDPMGLGEDVIDSIINISNAAKEREIFNVKD
jgi:hypothetical protein